MGAAAMPGLAEDPDEEIDNGRQRDISAKRALSGADKL